MKPCLDVLVIQASAWCRCTTRWSMSSATTARSYTSTLGRASTTFAVSATSCFGRHAQLAGVRVDDLHALAEVGEADAAGLEHDVVLRVAAGEHELARGRADRLLDDVAGDADDASCRVDRGAGPGEDLAGLLVLHEHAGPLEDLERPEVDVGEVVVGQHPELDAVPASAPAW